jgi:hypothetical protein
MFDFGTKFGDIQQCIDLKVENHLPQQRERALAVTYQGTQNEG